MRRPTRKKFNPEQKARSESEEWHSIQLAAYTAIQEAEVTGYEFRDTPKGCRLFRVKVIPTSQSASTTGDGRIRSRSAVSSRERVPHHLASAARLPRLRVGVPPPTGRGTDLLLRVCAVEREVGERRLDALCRCLPVQTFLPPGQ